MVGLIANPKAGNGKAVQIVSKFENLLLKQKVEHILAFTSENNINKVISEFEENGIRNIVVFGGDGTVNSVARNVLKKDIGIIVIPAGSGNDFSKSNWQNIDFNKLVSALKENRISSSFVDVGYIEELDICFFNSFGLGIAGSVAINVKKLGGYRIATIKSLLFDYRSFRLKLDEVYDGKCLSFHIGMNKVEGHGIPVFPNAKNDDGLADIIIIKKVPYFITPFKVIKVLKGTHIKDKNVIYKQLERFRFEIERELNAHYDGESFRIKEGCYSFRVLKKALKIIKWT